MGSICDPMREKPSCFARDKEGIFCGLIETTKRAMPWAWRAQWIRARVASRA